MNGRPSLTNPFFLLRDSLYRGFRYYTFMANPLSNFKPRYERQGYRGIKTPNFLRKFPNQEQVWKKRSYAQKYHASHHKAHASLWSCAKLDTEAITAFFKSRPAFPKNPSDNGLPRMEKDSLFEPILKHKPEIMAASAFFSVCVLFPPSLLSLLPYVCGLP